MAATHYGPVGTRVLFENDQVRVWEVELGPGETLPMHFHAHDYVVIIMTDGTTRVDWEDGRSDTDTHYAGEVFWRTAPHAHALTNLGTAPYRNRFVEVKPR